MSKWSDIPTKPHGSEQSDLLWNDSPRLLAFPGREKSIGRPDQSDIHRHNPLLFIERRLFAKGASSHAVDEALSYLYLPKMAILTQARLEAEELLGRSYPCMKYPHRDNVICSLTGCSRLEILMDIPVSPMRMYLPKPQQSRRFFNCESIIQRVAMNCYKWGETTSWGSGVKNGKPILYGAP